LDEDVGVLQHRQRSDHRHVAVVGHQVVAQRLQLVDPVGIEQLGDRVPVVHRDQPEHRLAAEQALVLDVVDVDLVVLVEVAVLAGGELEAGDPVPEGESDDQPDEGGDSGVLAELDSQPGPESLHQRARPSRSRAECRRTQGLGGAQE
jgi:hypothetical protein